MDSSLYAIIGLLLGVGVGIIIGRFLLKKLFKAQENSAQNKAKLILKDAENNAEILKKNKLLEAKERFLQMKTVHEQDLNAKNNAYYSGENESYGEVLCAVVEVLEEMAVDQVVPKTDRDGGGAAHEQGRESVGGPERLPDNQRQQ